MSNDLKNNLNLLASNFSNIKKNKKYFQSELKKNIFYFGKTHLKQLNTLNFLTSKIRPTIPVRITDPHIICFAVILFKKLIILLYSI